MKLIARAALSVVAASALSTAADASVTFTTGGGVTYQNNLFRTSGDASNVDTNGVRRRGSDVIYSVDGSAIVDAHPGEFDITGTATVGHDFYQRNTRLDNTNYSIGGTVARTQGALQMNVRAESARFLSSFGDVRNLTGNRQMLQSVAGDFSYPITPEIRVVARPTFLQNTNSADRLKGSDFRQYGGTAGLGYFTALGNSLSITAGQRQTDGLNDQLVFSPPVVFVTRTDAVDTIVNALLVYNFGPFTRLVVDANYVKRNDKSSLNNDYSGPSGTATLRYRPTSAIEFQLRGGRTLNTQSFVYVTSVRTDIIEGAVTYTPAERLAANFRVQYAHRKLDYDPSEIIQRVNRIDNTTSIVGQLNYRLLNRVDLGVQAAHYRRTSNIEFRDFNATTVGATLRFVFGPGSVAQTSQGLGLTAPGRGATSPAAFGQR